MVLTGQLLLAKGDVEQASAAFKIVLDGDRDNVPALLGQVILNVLNRKSNCTVPYLRVETLPK